MNLSLFDFIENLKIKKSKGSKKLILLLIVYFLINNCNFSGNNSIPSNENNNPKEISAINIPELLNALLIADNKLSPVLNYSDNGEKVYIYKKFPGEKDLTIKEIELWVESGSDYFKKNRINIQILLNYLNNLKVNNSIVNIDNGAWGLWIPEKNQIFLDKKLINMGSRVFLDVLRHESIHVAQSCFGGVRSNYPKRIGLPLEFNKEINMNLSHKFYSKNSREEIYIEREAFTYSKVDGAATKLLKKFCF